MFNIDGNFFAIAATAASFVGLFPYVLSIFRGQTKPSGASWWTWAFIGIITVLSSWAAGASSQVLILLIWVCFVQLLVALLSIKYGDNKWDLLNIFCIAGSCFGVVLWLITSQPIVALVISIITDIFASVPNFRHVWRNPEQENITGWTLGWISSVLEIFVISTLSIAEAAWPIYFLLNMSIILLLILRPHLIVLKRSFRFL